MGSATGKLLHSQGAKLALLYAPFEVEKFKPTLEENYGYSSSQDAGGKIKGYECDITSSDSITNAFEAIAKDDVAFPSMLINTAGYITLTPFEDFPAEDVLKHYLINLYGPTLTSQAFARLYIRRKKESGAQAPGGRIVTLASQAAHVALTDHGPYCASKAGLIGLNRCMANELGKHGITTNTVSPGPVMTEMGRKAWADKTAREEYLKALPSGGFAEPDEVARIVSFLCEDRAKNITGDDIRLDGGYTAK